MKQNESEAIKQQMFDALFKEYGPLLPSTKLWSVLGYPSITAFRQSHQRGQLSLPIIKIEGRRGQFALTVDVVDWLLQQKENTQPKHRKEIDAHMSINP